MPSTDMVPGPQKFNNSIPYMDPEEREQIASAPKIYIWNVTPREFVDYRGTLGRRVIPACPPGAEVSAPLVIDGWLPETAVDNVEGRTIQYKWLKTSGKKVALDILSQKDSEQRRLEDYGYFISAGPYPTEAELEAARGRWHRVCALRVREADDKYQVNGGMEAGDDGKFHSAITKDHLEAAKVLGVKRDWMNTSPVANVPCPGCDEPIKPTAAICIHCDAILDEPRARKLYPQKFAHEEKRGPGRPPKVE